MWVADRCCRGIGFRGSHSLVFFARRRSKVSLFSRLGEKPTTREQADARDGLARLNSPGGSPPPRRRDRDDLAQPVAAPLLAECPEDLPTKDNSIRKPTTSPHQWQKGQTERRCIG